MRTQKNLSKTSGFTIVELLIVIVVIAILATISVVAYRGIQNRAYDTTVQSDLRNVANKLELYKAEFGVLPVGDASLSGLGLKVTKASHVPFPLSGTASFLYCHALSSNGNVYALVAASKSGNWYQYGGSGTGVYSGSKTEASMTVCSEAGTPILDATPSSRTFLYQDGAWKSYVGS